MEEDPNAQDTISSTGSEASAHSGGDISSQSPLPNDIIIDTNTSSATSTRTNNNNEHSADDTSTSGNEEGSIKSPPPNQSIHSGRFSVEKVHLESQTSVTSGGESESESQIFSTYEPTKKHAQSQTSDEIKANIHHHDFPRQISLPEPVAVASKGRFKVAQVVSMPEHPSELLSKSTNISLMSHHPVTASEVSSSSSSNICDVEISPRSDTTMETTRSERSGNSSDSSLSVTAGGLMDHHSAGAGSDATFYLSATTTTSNHTTDNSNTAHSNNNLTDYGLTVQLNAETTNANVSVTLSPRSRSNTGVSLHEDNQQQRVIPSLLPPETQSTLNSKEMVDSWRASHAGVPAIDKLVSVSDFPSDGECDDMLIQPGILTPPPPLSYDVSQDTVPPDLSRLLHKATSSSGSSTSSSTMLPLKSSSVASSGQLADTMNSVSSMKPIHSMPLTMNDVQQQQQQQTTTTSTGSPSSNIPNTSSGMGRGVVSPLSMLPNQGQQQQQQQSVVVEATSTTTATSVTVVTTNNTMLEFDPFVPGITTNANTFVEGGAGVVVATQITTTTTTTCEHTALPQPTNQDAWSMTQSGYSSSIPDSACSSRAGSPTPQLTPSGSVENLRMATNVQAVQTKLDENQSIGKPSCTLTRSHSRSMSFIPDTVLQAVVSSDEYIKIKSKQTKEITTLKKRHNDELAAIITKYRQQTLPQPPPETTTATTTTTTTTRDIESPIPGTTRREADKYNDNRRDNLSREGSQEHLERDAVMTTGAQTGAGVSGTSAPSTSTTSSSSNNSTAETGKKSDTFLDEMFHKQLETMGNLSRNKQDTIQKSDNKPSKPSLNELKLKSQAEQMKKSNSSTSSTTSTSSSTSSSRGGDKTSSASASHGTVDSTSTSSNTSSQQQQQHTPKRKQTSVSQMSEQQFNQSLSALNLAYILHQQEKKDNNNKYVVGYHSTNSSNVNKPKSSYVADQGVAGGSTVSQQPGYTPYNPMGDQYINSNNNNNSTATAVGGSDFDTNTGVTDTMRATDISGMHSMTNSYDGQQQQQQQQQQQHVAAGVNMSTTCTGTGTLRTEGTGGSAVVTSNSNSNNCDVSSDNHTTTTTTLQQQPSSMLTSLGPTT
jgi:hypothetical protein